MGRFRVKPGMTYKGARNDVGSSAGCDGRRRLNGKNNNNQIHEKSFIASDGGDDDAAAGMGCKEG